MRLISLDFSKMPTELAEIIKESFRNLNIPTNPQDARIEQLSDIVFMALIVEAIQQANASDISLVRRREIMAEMILLDEKINKRAKKEAREYADKSDKAHLN